MFSLGSSVGDDVKWKSAIERALGTWESVVEWADYISFLARVQKAVKNKHRCDGSQLPLASNISEMLARCLEPSLPSGVHQMCIEVYDTVFDISGPQKLALTVNIWLPGLLPVVSWAAFNVKPMLVNLFANHIVPAIPSNSCILRELYKPLLLSMLPSIEEESSDCFVDICELLATLKKKQNDDSHYWQSFYLAVLTAPDCRLGALTLLQRMQPNLSESGLVIRAVCAGLEDENVLVQRGFLDVLVKLLPLDGDVLLSADKDKPKVIISACKTIYRKDMSLNRRLRLWLLGPDPDSSAETTTLSRFEYFKKFASETLSNVLLEQLDVDFVKTCLIARGLMDRWEISACLGTSLLKPILLKSQQLGHVESGVEAFFDNVDASVVWKTSLNMLDNGEAETVLFMVENFNITDEDMLRIYIPLVVVYLLCSESLADIDYQIVKNLLVTMSNRAMPLEPQTIETKQDLREQISEFFTLSSRSDVSEDDSIIIKNPLSPEVASWYMLKLSGDIFLESHSADLLNEVLKLFPQTPGLELTIPDTEKIIESLDAATSDQVMLFKFLMDKMSPIKVRSYVCKLVKDWADTLQANGAYELEKIAQLWQLNDILPDSIVPTAISTVLADSLTSPSDRAKIFSALWIQSIDQLDISSMLTKPLLLFLDLSTEDSSLFDAYLQSSIVRTGSTARMIKILIDLLDQESHGDIGVFTYVLQRLLVVLANKDVKTVYISKFAPLMCTLLLEWFDKSALPDSTCPYTLELAELTILDSRIKDGRVWLRRFVDALTQTDDGASKAPAPVSLMKFLAAAVPLLEQINDIRIFSQLCVSHLKSEVDFEAFSQLLNAIFTSDPAVEEPLLNEIIEKIKIFDDRLFQLGPQDLTDSNSIMHLLVALESILSTGITYFNSINEGGNSSGGGLASALAGFQVESPEDRSRVEKCQASLLRCVNAVVTQCCKYWSYLQKTREFGTNTKPNGEFNSVLHTTGRLKTRVRKLMSLCYSFCPGDTLEIVVENLKDMKTIVKMTHMFEGPRAATTLELLTNLAYNNQNMFEFTATYVDSLETDVLGDVWPIVQQFLINMVNGSNDSAGGPSQETILAFLADSVIPRFEHLRFKNRKKVVRDFADVYSKLLLSDISNNDVLGSAVEKMPMIMPESDRQASLLSRLFSAHFKSPTNLPQNARLLVKICETFNIAGSAPAKVWTRTVNDFIFESQSQAALMPLNVDKSIELKPVIRTWVQCDKDKVKEFISKLSLFGSGTGVLFGWSGTQELANSNLKRLAYLIICTPPTSLAMNWSKLMNQLANMWTQNATASCLLLRACLLSQPTPTMMAFMAFRLQSTIQTVIDSKSPVTGENARLLVEVCKLLDLAFATGIEQFQEFQWLFISDSGDIPSDTNKAEEVSDRVSEKSLTTEKSDDDEKSTKNIDPTRHRVGGLLEKLMNSVSLAKASISEQLTAPNPQYKSRRRPLLPLRATMKDIPVFLSQVTLTAYEEVYAMTTPDIEYCERWLLADLFE